VWLHSSDVQEAALPMPSLLGPTPSWQPVLGHLSLHCLGALLEHQASGDQTPLSKEPDTASPAWPFEDSHCVIVMYRKVVFFFLGGTGVLPPGRLASNVDLSFSSGWDYRCEPPVSSTSIVFS
jgi:hypothetical protein